MDDSTKALTALEKPKPLYPHYPAGRPDKYTAEEIAEIANDFADYIERTPDPIIVGFTTSYKKYPVNKQYMLDRQEFSFLVRTAVEKQEYFLQFGSINNKLNATFAIFRLKQPQHGWKDRIDTDITTGGDKIGVGLSADQTEQLLRARANRSDI